MFIRVTSVRDDLIAESRRTVTDCTVVTTVVQY